MTTTNQLPKEDWEDKAKKVMILGLIVLAVLVIIALCSSCNRHIQKSLTKTDSTTTHQEVKTVDTSKAKIRVVHRTSNNRTKQVTTTTPLLIQVDTVLSFEQPIIVKNGKKFIVSNKTTTTITKASHSAQIDSGATIQTGKTTETKKDSTHLVQTIKNKEVKSHPSFWLWWLLLIPAYLVYRYRWEIFEKLKSLI